MSLARAASPAGSPDQFATLRNEFQDPPREFGFMPLWFWNDDLTDDVLLWQVREFHAKGFGGFIIHPRVGLSRRVGYLTPEFFRLVKLVVEESERLGLKVVLYDEAGYPAGSARGRVVAENPDWAAKCLFQLQHKVKGPAAGYWRPNPGRALRHEIVTVVLGREIGSDKIDPESLRLLTWDERQLVHYDVPEGDWRIISLWQGHSGGNTRGAFEEEEDGHALAPAAADVLRPDVVAFFMQLTHDEYYRHLAPHFGKTIVAMFTDEPTPMGRIFDPVLRVTRHSWTPGFLDDLQKWWNEDVKRWLPALWLDCGPRTQEFRWAYKKAVHDRMDRNYYKPISEWCAQHRIALTGHPAYSNEMGTLRHFQWPGQDLVWRMVVPNAPSAMSGADSQTAKAASSAARLGGRRFNAVEIYGAYGWRLNFDEIKWLLDWHLVRGTNMFFLHAAFYSIRGRRAYESEPDMTVNNVYWPYFGLLGDYGRRMGWLITDGDHVCETGVVSDGDALAWAAAGTLLRNQQDFIFVDDPALRVARVEGDRLVAGTQRLRVLVIDQPGTLSREAEAKLTEFEAAGGRVLRQWTEQTVADQVAGVVGQEIVWHGDGRADLRTQHYRKGGLDFFMLVNEGENPLRGRARLRGRGGVELWEGLDGTTRAYPSSASGDGVEVQVELDRRATAVFAVNPRIPNMRDAKLPLRPGARVATVSGWQAVSLEGKPANVPALGDWARAKGWETFSGTIAYRARVTHAGAAAPRYLDLGQVGEMAEVWLNGRRVGFAGWAPYVVDLGDGWKTGPNQIEVRVTNTMANAYDGRQIASGLIGPVVFRTAQSPA